MPSIYGEHTAGVFNLPLLIVRIDIKVMFKKILLISTTALSSSFLTSSHTQLFWINIKDMSFSSNRWSNLASACERPEPHASLPIIDLVEGSPH